MSTHIIESRPAGYSKEQIVDPRRWSALPVLLTGAFLPILDFNVVNLALPAMRGDLGASSSQVQFVISAYAATYAVFLITGGRLGDLFVADVSLVRSRIHNRLSAVWCRMVTWHPGRRATPSRVCGDGVDAAGARLDPRTVSTR